MRQYKVRLVDIYNPDDEIEIGEAMVEQQADGSLDMKMTMTGDYTMSSNNISGMARLRGFILSSLRKD